MAGETILIVEDRRENIVHLANNVLKPQGYQILTAMDGQRGLKRILTDRPDLVIMDLNMPKMDGLEVLAALQDQQVDIPVILTTFYGSEQVAQQALRLGAVDYIVKPYDTIDMLKAIEKALARRAPTLVERAEAEDTMEQAMPLTRQVERWMRDVNILTRVGKALVAQLDLGRVYVRTVEAAIYATRADYGFLYLKANADPASLRLVAARGPRDPRARLLDKKAKDGLAAETIRSGEPQIRAKAPGDLVLFEIVGSAMGPAVAVPLRWQREIIGALMVARTPGEQSFGEPDAEWLSGLADYAAIAVRNSRLFQEQAHAAPPGGLPEAALAACQHEITELAQEIQNASERLQRVARLLAERGKGSHRT